MQRAALYARFSTDLQSERSVDDQLALCREYAARQGYRLAGDYFDKARSGASIFGRDGLLRLMDDARAGAFEVVVVEALDRLSRDQEDLAGLFKRLSFANVEIMAVHDGKADAMQVGIRGLVSTLFLTDLKHKIRRGMHGVVRDGRHAGGKAYGYRPTPGQPGVMVIDEAEAAIVRRIFAEALAGRRGREIAAGLNRDGIAPPRGAHWNASTISGSASRGYVFIAVDHCSGEFVGTHASSSASRWEALEPIRQGVTRHFGGVKPYTALGLILRHDHGSNCMADDFQGEIKCFGITSSPSFVRQPEGNGVSERAIRTLKQQLLWVHHFATVE